MTIDVWFDFASTYAYPAVCRVDGLAGARSVEVAWKPFLLGPIFAAQGWRDSPFNLYPAKGRYMWRDLERECAKHGLPFHRPSVFPRNGLLAARIACAAAGAPWLAPFIKAVFAANFAEDREIADPEVLEAVLDGLGQPGAQWTREARSPESKRRLRLQTEEARGLGIFGSPTFVVAGELFWGNDRLVDALDWPALAPVPNVGPKPLGVRDAAVAGAPSPPE